VNTLFESLGEPSFGTPDSPRAQEALGGAAAPGESRLTVIAWTYVNGEWYPAAVEEDAPPPLIA